MPIPTRSQSLRRPGFTSRDSQTIDIKNLQNPLHQHSIASLSNTVPNSAKEEDLPSTSNVEHQAFEKAYRSGLLKDPGNALTRASDHDLPKKAQKPPSPKKEEPRQLDILSYSRLPSPTKSTTKALDKRPTLDQKRSDLQPPSTESMRVSQKTQIGHSSSLRQPSTRAVLGQLGNARGRDKSGSVSHSATRAPSLRTVTEASKADTKNPEERRPQESTTNHPNDMFARRNNSIRHQRKLSDTRPVRQISSDLSESRSSTSKPSGARPQFSTYQQHFTPKKASKAPTRNVISPDLEEDQNDGVSRNNLRLRDELLQLSLLYTSAQSTKRELEQSAKRKLQLRFEQIAQQSAETSFVKQVQQTDHNLDHLLLWLSDGSCTPTEKVRVLSLCIRDITNMTRADGKAMRLVEEFQSWFTFIKDTMSLVEKRAIVSFVPLPPLWKDQVNAAVRSMENCQVQLQNLRSIDTTAAIGKTLDHLLKITIQTIGELNIMLELEGTMIKRAKQQTERAIEELLSVAENDRLPHEIPRTGVWNEI